MKERQKGKTNKNVSRIKNISPSFLDLLESVIHFRVEYFCFRFFTKPKSAEDALACIYDFAWWDRDGGHIYIQHYFNQDRTHDKYLSKDEQKPCPKIWCRFSACVL